MLAVEVMMSGALRGLSEAELAAAASCLLPQRAAARSATSPAGGEGDERAEAAAELDLPAPLQRALGQMRGARGRVVAALAPVSATVGVGDEGGSDGGAAGPPPIVSALARATLSWASGASFVESHQACFGEAWEGELVRALRALEHLLVDLAAAAEALGDADLRSRLEASGRALHRGLPFAPSLFLNG
mmetsp:Transcript_14435/g.47802  ORF Transcript_14435/g.47802 Transcript_14435/m.47802 type:complete len:189 (+) Transcript_14435:1283-1849(+)